MNFIFISPNFPHTYWQFCDLLKQNGCNVLGIGDCPYDGLEPELRASLTEYYKVDSMENYDSMFRAVAFLAFQSGLLCNPNRYINPIMREFIRITEARL